MESSPLRARYNVWGLAPAAKSDLKAYFASHPELVELLDGLCSSKSKSRRLAGIYLGLDIISQTNSNIIFSTERDPDTSCRPSGSTALTLRSG